MSGDTAPPEPVYGAKRVGASSNADVAAAVTDPHNPELDGVLARLDRQNVWLDTTPPQPGRTDTLTTMYFDLRSAPYSGRLDLFSVRVGGGEVEGTVQGLTLVTVRLRKGSVVGLEMNDPAVFTPDDPSAIPSSVPSGD